MKPYYLLLVLAACAEDEPPAGMCSEPVGVVHLQVEAVSGATVKLDELRYTWSGTDADATCTNMPCNEADLPLFGDLSALADQIVDVPLAAMWKDSPYTGAITLTMPAADACGEVSYDGEQTWVLDAP